MDDGMNGDGRERTLLANGCRSTAYVSTCFSDTLLNCIHEWMEEVGSHDPAAPGRHKGQASSSAVETMLCCTACFNLRDFAMHGPIDRGDG